MGPFANVPLPFDWSQPDAYAKWSASCDAARAREAATGKSAMQIALDKLGAGARDFTAVACKTRVRLWIKKPWRLDVLYPNLSNDRDGLPDDRKLIAVAEILLERTNVPTANVGFGGESPRITAQALMLYGRAVRRFRARQTIRVAA